MRSPVKQCDRNCRVTSLASYCSVQTCIWCYLYIFLHLKFVNLYETVTNFWYFLIKILVIKNKRLSLYQFNPIVVDLNTHSYKVRECDACSEFHWQFPCRGTRSSLLVMEFFLKKRWFGIYHFCHLLPNNWHLENTKWWQKPWNIFNNLLKCFFWTNSWIHLFTPLSCTLSSIFISFTASEWHLVLLPIPSCCCRWEFCFVFFQLPSFLLIFLLRFW